MPIEYQPITIQQPSRFRCDSCKTDFKDMRSSVRIQHTFGYDAPPNWDGESVDIVICEKCLLTLAVEYGVVASTEPEPSTEPALIKLQQSANFYGFSYAQAEQHPENGKQGFWKVEGIRHAALVQTDSALKAIELASEIVGDWELCDVRYLGASLPLVFGI